MNLKITPAETASKVRVAPLRFVETTPFHRFAYPGYQQSLWLASDRGPVCAVGAWVSDEPAGLAMSITTENDGLARICSIYVDERFRRGGVAAALLVRMEQSQRERGLQRLELGYRSGSVNAAATQRLLHRLGWPTAIPERLLCTCDSRMWTAEWLKAVELPLGYAVVSWSEVTRGERLVLVASQLRNPWIPPSLNPFNYEATMEANSVALRCRGEILGWILTQRFDTSTLVYSCNYLRPDLQRRGFMIPLLREAIRRQVAECENPKGFWVVPYEHQSMVRFVRRRMAKYAIQIEDYCISVKALSPATGIAA